MSYITKRLALATVALAMAGTAAAGVYAAARDQNTSQPPAPFSGRGPGGRGGPGRGMGPGAPMGLLPMIGRELQLTDAQRDQVKAIADSHRDEWRGLADRARTAHQALDAAVTANTIDETLIRSKSAEVAAIEADMAVARAHAYAEVVQILTSDQKAKLQTLQAARQNGRGPRHH
jgi:protein CpxP